jgi:hypothetical protein
MNTLALILLIIGGIAVMPLTFAALFVFLTSFDAPNADFNIREWSARIGIILGVAVLGGLVYFAYDAFLQNDYKKTITLISIELGALIVSIWWMYKR